MIHRLAIAIYLLGCLTKLAAAYPSAVSDSLYNANHPRLLFNATELPALRQYVTDGGYDQAAYDYIRYLVDDIYPTFPPSVIVSNNYGLFNIPNVGLGAHFHTPMDTSELDMGRAATLHLANAYDVDFNEADSGLRLRSLALGYDMFFANAPDSERTFIREEIESYLQLMVSSVSYDAFKFRPYLGNHSAMFAGALGLAGVCLQGELDQSLLDDALDLADEIVDSLLTFQFDPGGAYKEGVLYGAWTMRNLIPYFHARKRFDGLNYGDDPRIRNMVNWMAYELLPEGNGASNNINDSSTYTYPLALHNTYFDWAQTEWSSPLAAWIWEHTSGPYGIDLSFAADKAATALWNRSVAPQSPQSLLPKRSLWAERGLYYYRSGWSELPGGDDVVFSFYSGKFHGGHAQSDQNNVTLYGYGGRFLVDHGPGIAASRTSAHSLVLIDGDGQHNAGFSIGTDGRIAEFLLSDFADYLMGDATDAYTTYSPFNRPDYPFPGSDWSWGYGGANPVLYAERRVWAVHDPETPPYFLMTDNVNKDGNTHDYELRLHTRGTNTIDTAQSPFCIEDGPARLDVHLLSPDPSGVTVATTPYNNGATEPNSKLLQLETSAIDPNYALLLLPRDTLMTPPTVDRTPFAWGVKTEIDWGEGLVDVFVKNDSGDTVTCDSLLAFETDAKYALVRTRDDVVIKYVLSGVRYLTHGGTTHVQIFDGPVNCALTPASIQIDRDDADFRFYGPDVIFVSNRETPLQFTRDGDHVVPAVSTSAPDPSVKPPPRTLRVSAFPNPFNPVTVVHITHTGPEVVRATIFNVSGRRVRRLWNAPIENGTRQLKWNGRDDRGIRVASGVYFLKVSSGRQIAVLKVTMAK